MQLEDEPTQKKARAKNVPRSTLKRPREEEEEDASQEISRSRPRVSHEGENVKYHVAGIIDCVEVENFLCHSNLKVKLNKNVSFIVGVNGSGKSAILTAISLALGERASATSRGSSAKDLIKTGESRAVVRVTLVNQGVGAYKPEIYGSFIIVERVITITGSGGYKIRNVGGRVIATRRDELNRILAHMNLQIDNPVCVLNQETAKNFLNSNDPKQRYKLFERATQLDLMKADLQTALDEIDRGRQCLESKRDDLTHLKEMVDTWKEKMEQFQNIDDLQETIRELHNEIAWSQHEDIKEKVEESLQKLNKHKALVETGEKSKEEKQLQLDQTKEKIEELKNEAIEKQQLAKSKDDEQKVFEGEVRELVQKQRAIQQEQRQLQRDLQNKQSEKAEIEASIDSRKNENINEQQRKKEAALADIEKLQSSLDEAVDTIKTSELHLGNLRETNTKLTEEAVAHRAEASNYNRQYESRKRDIEELHRANKDPFSLFGDWVPVLRKKIEQAPFRVQPKGPLGAYVKLKENSWAPLVENILYSRLHSFIVDNDDDCRLLNKIIKETARGPVRPTVFTSKFLGRKHDVSNSCITLHFTRKDIVDIYTLLDIIVVDDPDVFNALVDYNSIETVLLFGSDDAARRVMSDRTKVPANCRIAYSRKGFVYHPDPGYKTYPGNCGNRARFLQVSIDEILKNLQEEADAFMQQRDEANAKLDVVNRRLGQNRGNLSGVEARLNVLKRNAASFREEIKRLRESIPDEAEPPDVLCLEEDLLAINTEIADLEARISILKDDHDSLKTQVAEATARHAKTLNASRAAARQYNEIKDRIDTLEQEQAENISSLERTNQRLRLVNEQVASLQQEYDRAVRNAQLEKEKAEQVCPQVPARPLSEVTRQLQQVTKQLESQEKSCGNRDQVFAEYQRLQAEHGRAKEEWTRAKNDWKRMNSMHKTRTRFVEQFSNSVRYRTEHVFLNYMKCSKIRGQLDIDHKERVLNVLIFPPGTNGENGNHSSGSSSGSQAVKRRSSYAHTNTQSLSGGERSFTTICLILSLWDAIESPFRMLDEFDVFMDTQNRRTSLALLLEETTKNRSRQFVFLTPLGIEVATGPTVSILKMQDPERPVGRPALRAENEEDN